MSADTRPRLSENFGEKRHAFRGWRGQRPFWAGLLTLLAGFPIMYIPYANLTIGSLTVRMATTAGAGSLIIGVLLVVLGLTMWFQPASRVFAGVAAILLSLVSLVVSNIGAFLVGFLLGLIGGALSVSWAPERQAKAADGDADRPAPAPDPAGPTEPAGPAAPLDLTAPAGPALPPQGRQPHEWEHAGDGSGTGTGAMDDLSGTSPTNGTNGRHRAG